MRRRVIVNIGLLVFTKGDGCISMYLDPLPFVSLQVLHHMLPSQPRQSFLPPQDFLLPLEFSFHYQLVTRLCLLRLFEELCALAGRIHYHRSLS